jgi:sugar phosphate isomerase/epimerase
MINALSAFVFMTTMSTAPITTAPIAAPSFRPSVQAWSFNRYSAFVAIEKASQVGSEYIEFYPGQKLADDRPAGMGPDLSDEDIKALQAQLEKFKVKPIAFGVTGIPKDEAGARKLFSWAKKLGIEIINTESTDALDTIEKMVKEFDIKVGFHNHPKQEKNPNYKVWDPAYVYSIVKDRDQRIGSCADTGHWVRSGIKPVDAIRTLKGRIVASHLKDLNVFSPAGHDVAFGQGVSDIQAILKEYQAIGFKGSVSVEFEHNWDTSVPEIAQCIGFMRGFVKSRS